MTDYLSQVEFVINDQNENDSQVENVITCMKSIISSALLEKLKAIKRVRYLSFDKIKLLQSDFKDHELPAIQIIDVSEAVIHEQNRTKNTWQLALEIVMRGNENESVTQPDLWNMEYEVKRKIWADPTLGIQSKGMVHLRLLGTTTDLHLLEPFYFCRMDFEAIYYEHIVRDC